MYHIGAEIYFDKIFISLENPNKEMNSSNLLIINNLFISL